MTVRSMTLQTRRYSILQYQTQQEAQG